MSMTAAMNAGVSGMAGNANRLSTISENISNSSTYGYKRMETDFDNMVLSTRQTNGLYSAGGVLTSSRRIVDQQGGLVTSEHPLDIAISGRGFLPVTNQVDLRTGKIELSMMMSRTGSFRQDEEGILRADNGQVLLGWPALPDGTIPTQPRDSLGGLEAVHIPVNQTAGDPTTWIDLGINLPAGETEVGKSGAPIEMKVEYFGNLGGSEDLRIVYTPVPSVAPAFGKSNAWTVEIFDEASDPAVVPGGLVAKFGLTFHGDQAKRGSIETFTMDPSTPGAVYDPTTGEITFNVGTTTTLAGDMMTMQIGRPGGQTGLRQLDASFAQTTINKDGAPVGHLTNVEVDGNGFIKATYDTGFIRTLYQIPLVDVPNPNGLIAVGKQAYVVSPESGSFFLWDAGDGPTGEMVGYAREESTTDVAGELTDLIVTQRAYSSNAKVIQTVDEMLQETTNIKR